MRVSADVIELVQILNEGGFGATAGELLMEIGLGREIDDGGDGDGKSGIDDAPRREPLSEADQMTAALAFLELRLVEPVRRLAQAEAIAGLLSTPNEPTGKPEFLKPTGNLDVAGQAEPVKIIFLPPQGRDGPRFDRSEPAGATRAAELLSRVLGQLKAV